MSMIGPSLCDEWWPYTIQSSTYKIMAQCDKEYLTIKE